MSTALEIIAVLALIGLNAFFVVGEYSVVTARRSVLAARDSAGARAALRLMEDPVRVISTVQVGITAVGILVGALSEPVVADLLPGGTPEWVSFVVGFTVVTYLSVVLGELVPKALTLDRAERLAAVVARPIEVLSLVLRPAVVVLQASAGVLLRPFGISRVVAGDTVRTADELRALVDEAEGAGVIPRAQEEMLHNVFDFADREVRDVMVAAHAVDWIDVDLTCEQALERVREAPHGRYPVGEGSLDHLRGIVFVYDLIRGAADHALVGRVAREAFVVPETKDLGALLRELRERREKLAVVMDEYGGVSGIVSMEDVLEELVGEIEDEYDLPDSRIVRVDDDTVLAAGSMTIDDFNEEIGTALSTEGPRTLSGLVFERLGRKPEPTDEVELAGVRLRVEDLDGMRIARLRITVPR